MNKIYHLASCSTCKRILNELGDVVQTCELQNIKETHISAQELDDLAKKVGSYEAIFSKNAQLYREQRLNERQLSEADFRELILSHYTFLKRPVIILGDSIQVGSKKK